jgi:hypothetical protein
MALFLGTENYSKFKPYLEGRVDYANTNDDLDVTECLFKKIDTGVAILFALKNIKICFKPEQYQENQLCYLILHKEKYEVWTKENPKTPTEPTELELFLLDLILEKKVVELDKLYTGTISLNSSSSVIEAVKQFEKYDILLKLTEKEGDPLFLKDATESKNGFGKGGYAKNQTEYEKLQDRTKWIMEQCGQPSDTKLKDFDPTTIDAVAAMLSFIFN